MRTFRLVLTFMLVPALFAVAQSDDSFDSVQSEHYRVLSEVGTDQAARTASKLEAMLELYNEYFHFDVDQLEQRFTVRIFEDKEGYDDYLNRVLGETREDFVYLHYGNTSRNELVGYDQEGREYDLSLSHQSFIQFVRTFIDNPPLWLREGFAVFFEQTEYDDQFESVLYRENLSWLGRLKEIVSNDELIPVPQMLSMGVEDARDRIDVFYPQAWGMVSFLVNSEHKDVNRILWDTISALQPEASLSENVERVKQEVLKWVDMDQLSSRFVSYVESRRSFRGLVEEGMDLYDGDEKKQAEELFVKALNLRTDNYIPYYYLGLINYDRDNYELAEFYYNKALDSGSAKALTYYALGVNAYADQRFDEAQDYLEQTLGLNSETYGPKAEQLLSRLEDS